VTGGFSSCEPVPRPSHPPAKRGPGIAEAGEVIVVVPAEGFDLLEEVQSVEVGSELEDEGSIELWIEGVGRETVLEIIQYLGHAGRVVSSLWPDAKRWSFGGERRLC
jgi:hypothetical protein